MVSCLQLINWLKDWFYDESEVDTLLSAKQDNLVSGTNIKTINNESLLGSGNVSVVTKTSDLTNDGEDGTNPFVSDDDSRLSDARTPTSHTHTKSQITDFPTLSTVATSGSYNDLSNKPSIPSKISDLTDDSTFIKKSNTTGLVKNDGTIDTTSYSTFNGDYTSLSNKPSIPSKISDLTDDSDFIKKSQTSGLVKNDGSIDTNTYLTQHQSLSNYVQKSQTSGLLKNDGTVDTSSYSTFSGSYNDLSNKPTIPKVFYGISSTGASTQTKAVTTSSDYVLEEGTVLFVKFTNNQTYNASADNPVKLKVNNSSTNVDVAYVGTTKTSRYMWRAGEVVGFVYDGTNFVIIDNGIASTTYYGVTKLVDSVTSTSTSTSATPNSVKTAYDLANGKQDALVSGTNIKTINNESLLGSGNISVGGGSNVTKTSDLTNDGEDGVNPFVSDDDSRLSDARTPTSHTHTKSQITDFPTLSTVATSGSYNDLSNKPTIPTDVSQLTDNNDTKFTPKTHTHTSNQVTDFGWQGIGQGWQVIISYFDIETTDYLGEVIRKLARYTYAKKAEKSHTHTKSEITDFPTLSTVATSGSYNDLSNKPTIPTDVSDLTDNNNTAFTPKSHSHHVSEVTDMQPFQVLVTYTDNTTETIAFMKYTGN